MGMTADPDVPKLGVVRPPLAKSLWLATLVVAVALMHYGHADLASYRSIWTRGSADGSASAYVSCHLHQVYGGVWG
jgi:hypothetical protein